MCRKYGAAVMTCLSATRGSGSVSRCINCNSGYMSLSAVGVITRSAPDPTGETAQGLRSGEGRAPLQRRLQAIVDAYREADVAAAAERRHREQRRVAMTEDSDNADDDEDEDEALKQQGDADGAPWSHHACDWSCAVSYF